jgi:hypothetical protein
MFDEKKSPESPAVPSVLSWLRPSVGVFAPFYSSVEYGARAKSKAQQRNETLESLEKAGLSGTAEYSNGYLTAYGYRQTFETSAAQHALGVNGKFGLQLEELLPHTNFIVAMGGGAEYCIERGLNSLEGEVGASCMLEENCEAALSFKQGHNFTEAENSYNVSASYATPALRFSIGVDSAHNASKDTTIYGLNTTLRMKG